MKVLLIDVNCKGSSTGQIVYNLYSFLNKKGDEAAVCYGRGEKIKEKNIYKFGLDWETYLHAFLTRVTGYTGCFSYFSTRRLIKFIENYNPDVVHIHELHAYFVNIAQLLKYLAKKNIKVVHTLHCEFSYTGKCGHSVECDKWKTVCNNCPRLRDYPVSLFFDHTRSMFLKKKKLFNQFQDITFVAPSKWLLNRMKESFLANQTLKLIHNSIDTTIFYPKDTKGFKLGQGIPIEKKVILAVAPNIMSENKGGHYIIQLAEMLKDYYFIIIGNDDPQDNKANISFKGIIKDKELLANYYSMADLFVICSKNENFPTTCIEALCCGTKVAGFSSGGTEETIVYPILGSFVEYGNINKLGKLIDRICTSTYSEEETDAFKKTIMHYSLNRMCDDYYKLYD